MTRALPFVVVMALAACSAQRDATQPGAATTRERTPPGATTTPPSTSNETPPTSNGGLPAVDPPAPPATPPSEAAVPERFRGTYAIDTAACHQAGQETRLEISNARIRFHESSGPVTQATAEGDTLRLTAEMTGEGETRMATYRFTLSQDGSQLRDMDHGVVRVRCP